MELTQETIDRLEEELYQDKSVKQIAKEWEMSERTLYDWISRGGLDTREIKKLVKKKKELDLEAIINKNKPLSYAQYLSKEVKKKKMTSKERQKIMYKFKNNYDAYIFLGEVQRFDPEDVDI